jgi:5-methylcytosine-specific restriction endonuclease McrA
MGKRPGNGTRKAVYKLTKHKCFYCGEPASTIDHVIPRSHGGSHDADNLVAACHRCNQTAGNRWFPSRELKRDYIRRILDTSTVVALSLGRREER